KRLASVFDDPDAASDAEMPPVHVEPSAGDDLSDKPVVDFRDRSSGVSSQADQREFFDPMAEASKRFAALDADDHAQRDASASALDAVAAEAGASDAKQSAFGHKPGSSASIANMAMGDAS